MICCGCGSKYAKTSARASNIGRSRDQKEYNVLLQSSADAEVALRHPATPTWGTAGRAARPGFVLKFGGCTEAHPTRSCCKSGRVTRIAKACVLRARSGLPACGEDGVGEGWAILKASSKKCSLWGKHTRFPVLTLLIIWALWQRVLW